MINVDTNGQAGSDELLTVTPDGSSIFTAGDIIILRQNNQGRQINVLGQNNISLNGGNKWIAGDGEQIWLVYVPSSPGSKWIEISRYPHYNDAVWKAGSFIVNTGVVNIDEDQRYLKIEGEYAGEVRATFDIVIPAVVTTGNFFDVRVDNGIGVLSLGTYNSVGISSFDAANWGAIIDADPRYSATWVGSTITVEAPIGTGITPNNSWQVWTTESVADGLIPLYTPAVFFTGGVNGTAQADTIDTINYGSDGQSILLYNPMPAGFDLTLSTAGNIDRTYTLGSLDYILAVYNGDLAKWQLALTSRGTGNVYIHPEQMFPAPAGTRNGVSVLPSTLSSQLLSYYWLFEDDGDPDVYGVIFRIFCPSSYATDSNINLTLYHSGEIAGVAPSDVVRFQLGYLPVRAGGNTQAAESYLTPVDTIVPPTTANLDFRSKFTLTFGVGTGPSPGDYVNVIFFREDNSVIDTYLSDTYFHGVKVEF